MYRSMTDQSERKFEFDVERPGDLLFEISIPNLNVVDTQMYRLTSNGNHLNEGKVIRSGSFRRSRW